MVRTHQNSWAEVGVGEEGEDSLLLQKNVKFEISNLEEKDKSLERYNLLRLNQEERENMKDQLHVLKLNL